MLTAFDFFQTDRLSLGDLVRCAMAGTCPSAEAAQAVITSMVSAGVLVWEKDDKEVVWFSRVKVEETEC